MNVTRSLLDDIKTKQLQWYGHVQRMEVGRLPKEVMIWSSPGRRKWGRPKLTWAEGIRGLMGEKGLTLWHRNYFFLILAHSVYKMWIIQGPNKLALWNKLHFEEKKTESIEHV